MANKDNPSQPEYPTRPPLDQDQQGLVTAMTAALTEAIRAARRDVPPPDQAATAAATEYGKIKGALRTHSEPIPAASSTAVQAKYEWGGIYMFRQLPNYLSTNSTTFNAALAPPTNLFDRHPLDVVAYMEAYWNKRKPQPPLPPRPCHR